MHMIRTGGCVYRLRGRGSPVTSRVKKPDSELKELKDLEAPLEVEDEEENLDTDKNLNSNGDIASNVALASFCSNSIIDGAIDSNTFVD